MPFIFTLYELKIIYFTGSWPGVENRLLPPHWSDIYHRANWKQYFITVTRVSSIRKLFTI